MKRLISTLLLAGALLVPAAAVAQDESPAASPEESMAPIGVDTFDVCLAISGPVIQLTPEALTQGISDGTFVIEGLSDQCETGLMAPSASPMSDDGDDVSDDESDDESDDDSDG
jgi:hypothetical protein